MKSIRVFLLTVPPLFPVLLLVSLQAVSGQGTRMRNPAGASVCSQEDRDSGHHARIVFYNTENLFDTFDDSLAADDDFLPGGTMHWTYGRYKAKLDRLCKVITAAGGWTPPDIIGVCEIENDRVLYDLLYRTPLVKFEYRFVHRNSPDPRGIDVALIYNPATVRILEKAFIPVVFPDEAEKRTRDILYTMLLLGGSDTIDLFVNHWPSRSNGMLETEPFRLLAAGILHKMIASVLCARPCAKVIAMGDFNDGPYDKSLSQVLQAKTQWDKPLPGDLLNLAAGFEKEYQVGSHKFMGQWNMLDQIIVSGSLLTGTDRLMTDRGCFSVFAPPYLLTEDKRYAGVEPFRTYKGPVYQGGFSDHLPVMVDIFW